MVLLEVAAGFGYPVKLAKAWLGNDPCDPPWQFITCDAQGEVTTLRLDGQQLSRYISPAIANLTALKTVNLSSNNLTGSIPYAMTELPQLQMVDVSNNNITGFSSNVSLMTLGNPFIGKVVPGGGGSYSSGSFPGSNVGIHVLIGGGLVLVIAFVIYVLYTCHRRRSTYKKPKHKKFVKAQTFSPLKIEIDNMDDTCAMMRMDSLLKATENFSEKNVLGKGGFGVVYKEVFKNGVEVGAKRMKSKAVSSQGIDEIEDEIGILKKVRHRHLVKVMGYCTEWGEELLVYEFMPNGTLEQHLFKFRERGREPLSWKQRLVIVLDIARGVEYLLSVSVV
ncbi:putative receptor protein kinase TMK1 [Acorus calamus]|uniref:Receptor protein kinase TMK1 n=1 Tax=Acorus calamus TaxID=4465 RepID=A0AAV9F392_ACOCL|nr:putative receptor protein kinase TMK1 [Acorus calamus]